MPRPLRAPRAPVLFVVGAVLLVRETWLGIGALDRRFEKIMEVCRRLTDRRPWCEPA